VDGSCEVGEVETEGIMCGGGRVVVGGGGGLRVMEMKITELHQAQDEILSSFSFSSKLRTSLFLILNYSAFFLHFSKESRIFEEKIRGILSR
jgi:hypothetical protein